MGIFEVLSLFGGLAMFLYGMNVMGDSLAKTAGGKLERILEKLTSTPIRGVLLGAGVTAVIQSSSATTVMVVGFVNSGIMKLSQAVGIIMGANIGTTITSWILSLSGIEGDAFWIKMLKPSSFSPILAFIGIVLMLFTKSEKKKDIGTILLGFTVLMFGMDMMSDSVSGLKDVPEFTSILTMFSNPILGLLAGAVLTAIIQSSSASVGILQALCITGAVPFSVVIPIIMGQNIGTCVTALLSSIGAKKNAKRAAFVHLYFNVIGTTIFMILFYLVNAFVHFEFLGQAANAAGIAVVHTIFNVVATLFLLPMSGILEKMAVLTVRVNEEEATTVGNLQLLDVRFLEKPAFAVAQCVEVAKEMANLSKEALLTAIDLYDKYDEEKAKKVIEIEEIVDCYDDELGNYLVKLSNHPLSVEDNQTITTILQCKGDFERISDHAINVMEIAQNMEKLGQSFSDDAKKELDVFRKALREIMEISFNAFKENDADMAFNVEPLEEAIDHLHAKMKRHHVKRLQNGKCTIELGLGLEDLITNLERTADHCSNIAVSLLQSKVEGLEAHEYLIELKKEKVSTFQEMFQEYRKKYVDIL
ncbi:MAG: Na/Pi cotransporter family protein [Lachnospiraceae bacterium]|nr:Na/Pi cotransporter family protein [Lachnospiraceae bacterium]